MSELSFVERMVTYVRAGDQAFFVPAVGEASRAEINLIQVADKLSARKKMNILFWDSIQGFTGIQRQDAIVIKEGTKYKDIQVALKFITSDQCEGDILFVFRDAHPYLSRVPEVRRCFLNIREKNLFNAAGQWRRPIIFLSGKRDMHDEIQHYVTEVLFELPDEVQLERTFQQISEQVLGMLKDDPAGTCSPELKRKLILATLGMTDNEAERALYFCTQQHKGFKPEMLDTLEEEKAKVLGSSKILNYVPRVKIAGMDQIGGYDNLIDFIKDRKLAYTPEAQLENLDYPRGIILVGIPGTAKSICAKAIAKELDLPLVVMDYSATKGSLVGESENKLKDTLEQVRALKGSVLLIDEFDKAAQGQKGDNTGVSQALMGILLTWLTERPKDDRTFVVLTMNRTEGISPESFRSGRFDRMFHTSFPNLEDRWKIFCIHCRKRGLDHSIYNQEEMEKFVNITDGFTGAEIEQAIKDARFVAFRKRAKGLPTMAEILEECINIPIVKKLDPENITAIEEFCKRAGTYPVAKPKERKISKAKRGLDMGSWSDG